MNRNSLYLFTFSRMQFYPLVNLNFLGELTFNLSFRTCRLLKRVIACCLSRLPPLKVCSLMSSLGGRVEFLMEEASKVRSNILVSIFLLFVRLRRDIALIFFWSFFFYSLKLFVLC